MRAPAPKPVKKGDVVEARIGDDVVVGIVTKVSRGKASFKTARGSYSGPAGMLRHTDRKPDFDVSEPKVADFPKGTVVAFRAKGKGEVVGVVVGAGRSRLSVHTSGGTYDVPAAGLKTTDREPDFDVAAAIAANEPPAKGDVVEVQDPRGGIRRGLVVKVTKSYAVVRTTDSEIDAPFDLIESVEATPAVDASDAMSRYDVKSYKEHAALSQETTAFSANITFDGKVVLQATNDGHGGCNMYYPTTKSGPDFHADVKRWAEENGHPDAFEPEDQWIDWHRFGRVIGVAPGDAIYSLSSPTP